MVSHDSPSTRGVTPQLIEWELVPFRFVGLPSRGARVFDSWILGYLDIPVCPCTCCEAPRDSQQCDLPPQVSNLKAP